MKIARALSLIALTISCVPAFGWDDLGHRVVGILAYNHLSPSAQLKLTAILKQGEPSFASGDNPAQMLGHAATFPDFIKRNQQTSYEREINYYNDWSFPPELRKPNNNEASRMRVWHYINRPLFTEKHGDHIDHAPFDAVKAVNFIEGQIKKEETGRMKSFWIYWMSHIVGDMHQPLHCAASCAESSFGDAGGNGFKLSGDPSNLHFLWDSAIKDATTGDSWPVDPIEKAKKIAELHPRSNFEEQIKVLNADKWADEGAELAKNVVYADIQANTKESSHYRQRRTSLALKQAALGGYRLAAVLEHLLR